MARSLLRAVLSLGLWALVQGRVLLSKRSEAESPSIAGPYASRKMCRPTYNGLVECLPDIMLVGQSKAGTTSVSEALIHHPAIDVQFTSTAASVKDKALAWEAHIFDFHKHSQTRMLNDHWATAPKLWPSRAGQSLQLQYTPNYMYYPDAPFNILDVYPNARSLKYIFVLREPVHRAVSGWRYHRQISREQRSFSEVVEDGIRQRHALEACYRELLQRRSPCPGGQRLERLEDLPRRELRRAMDECFWGRSNTHDTTLPTEQLTTLMHAHVDKGVYVDQLRRWFALVGRQNCFVLTLEEWTTDPRKVFGRLAAFLGIPVLGPGGYSSAAALDQTLRRRWNDDSRVDLGFRPPAQASEASKRKLEQFYAPYNEELFELLGRRLW